VTPGRLMSAEIAEQPEVFANVLARRQELAAVAARIFARKPRFVLLAGRGSSGHAARYAKYLTEILLGLPAGQVSPSTTTLYAAQPDLNDVLLLAVSQSGGSPDMAEVVEAGRRCGATTVAVTNNPGSPLGSAAEIAVDVGAGPERCVTATKTYSATLLALYLLVDAARGGRGGTAEPLPELARATLDAGIDAVSEAVRRYRDGDRILCVGRGYSLPTAEEAALKITETSYLPTTAFGGADLLHGPIAAVGATTMALAICNHGKALAAMNTTVDALNDRGARVCAIGSAAGNAVADPRIEVPRLPEELAPVLEVLPVQQLALRLALSRGGDPDSPRGLRKVTRTR
jgi:glutamine---fructose-6-phosphate transaminase (isomerizing)